MALSLLREGDDPAGKPVRVCGFKVRIEYPAGSLKVKRAKEDGKVLWTRKMKNDYGYVVGVMGADGDSLDCFLCPQDSRDEDAPVHVVHQLKAHDGSFDEDKAFIGYPSKRAAVEAFKAHCHDFENLYGGVSTYPADGFAERYGADFEEPEADVEQCDCLGASGNMVPDFAAAVNGAAIPVSGKPAEADPEALEDFTRWMIATGWDVFPRPDAQPKADPSYEAIGPGFSIKGKKRDIDRRVQALPESIRAKTKVRLAENLAIGELKDMVSKRISVDEYVAKDGGDNVVVAFFVMGASTAVEPLRAFCESSPHVILADSGDSDTEKNVSIVYCELDRKKITAEKLDSLVVDVCRVTDTPPAEVQVAFPGSGDRLFPYSLRTMEAFVSGVRKKLAKKASEQVSENFWLSPAGAAASLPNDRPELKDELKRSGWVGCEAEDLTDASVLILESASMTAALLAAKRAAAALTLPLRGIVVELGKSPGDRRSVFESLGTFEAVASSRRCSRSRKSAR